MTDIATPLAKLPAATWFKSSYSGGEGNECVEVACVLTRVGIRDSKVSGQRGFTVSADAFAGFVEGLKCSSGGLSR
ncbi:DUF397 domain-containing protein [Streptomyces sp. DT2A-34]|uniref:DUF397 domain-containing protein n=1 Tax=Streptomyces sp. DT2A-34 TaxID=3051182 RepID=UPI00265C231B|nr:DUF397 domain-containing protein [Streptomyces sp. DT2A-34]MDO0914305.1 DUF397 domain-containing protein [Streptomyces sp. DT2A-34]